MTSILSSANGLGDVVGRDALKKNKKVQESLLPPIGAASASASGPQKVMAVTDYLKAEKGQQILLDRSIAAKTEVNAQLAAQGGNLEEVTEENSPEEEFLKFARMSPAEKMRALILGEMGVTEQQLAAMSPEERAKVEEKIAARLKERMKQEMEKRTSEGPETSSIEVSV